MALPRRLWDSSVIIGYLSGSLEVLEISKQIIAQAERGELEIVVSAVATVEVAYLRGLDDQDSETMIQEFFGRDYIVPVNIDLPVASIARGLVRKYGTGPKLKPPDATHLATAIHVGVPLIETTDPDLLQLDGREGNPPIMNRKPLYQGPQPLFTME